MDYFIDNLFFLEILPIFLPVMGWLIFMLVVVLVKVSKG